MNLSIDGVQPRHQLRVDSAEQLADLLSGTIAAGGAVVPVGGATALGYGNVPKEVQATLDLTGLDRVLDYQPSDLTMSVQAGATMASIQETLATHGQHLAIDVPFHDRATIGGVIATATAGPRRLADGTLRDQIVGASFVRSDGSICKAGGTVVKNVSGFDLARMLHGSLGTLAVIASVNLKVAPAPNADATLIARAPDVPTALALAQTLLRQTTRPTALEMAMEGDDVTVAARFTGGPAGVAHLRDESRSRMTAAGLAVVDAIDGDESRRWWQHAIDELAEERSGAVQIRAALRPSAVEGYVGLLRPSLATIAPGARLAVSPGVASVRVTIDDAHGKSAGWLAHARQAVATGADAAIIEYAPPSLKHDLDVWGEASPQSIAVMRAVKREMDPREVLNTGRFIDFI